jgi:hypothetical protein
MNIQTKTITIEDEINVLIINGDKYVLTDDKDKDDLKIKDKYYKELK